MWILVKFHHIAFPGNAEGAGEDREPPENQGVAPALPLLPVVGPGMEQIALHGPQILPPQALNVDEGPLAAAESEMLQARQLERLLLRPAGHPRRRQATPSGRDASSTVT